MDVVRAGGDRNRRCCHRHLLRGRKLFDLAALFDRVVIDGAVNGVAHIIRSSGFVLRRVQTGFVRSYALGVALGAFVLMGYFFLARAS